jgi:hypothetical protein
VAVDAKSLVAAGYDQIADGYLDWRAGADVRCKYLERLLELVPVGGRVLDQSFRRVDQCSSHKDGGLADT